MNKEKEQSSPKKFIKKFLKKEEQTKQEVHAEPKLKAQKPAVTF